MKPFKPISSGIKHILGINHGLLAALLLTGCLLTGCAENKNAAGNNGNSDAYAEERFIRIGSNEIDQLCKLTAEQKPMIMEVLKEWRTKVLDAEADVTRPYLQNVPKKMREQILLTQYTTATTEAREKIKGILTPEQDALYTSAHNQKHSNFTP